MSRFASRIDRCLAASNGFARSFGLRWYPGGKHDRTSASSFPFSPTWLSSVVLVVEVVEVVAILNFGLVALSAAETALTKRIPGIPSKNQKPVAGPLGVFTLALPIPALPRRRKRGGGRGRGLKSTGLARFIWTSQARPSRKTIKGRHASVDCVNREEASALQNPRNEKSTENLAHVSQFSRCR